MRSSLLLALCCLIFAARSASADDAEWQSLIPNIDLDADRVEGDWSREGDSLRVGAEQRARIALPVAPTGEYDYRVTFTRHTGRDSIALLFVHGGHQATFEVDAWGQRLSGIQNIGGQSIQQNPTRRDNQRFENGQRYTMTVEVRKNEVRALLGDEVLATYETDGSDLAPAEVWRIPQTNRLGLGAWQSETEFHAIEVRAIDGGPLEIARSEAGSRPATTTPNPSTRPTPTRPTPNRPQPTTPATTTNGSARGKRVLIVIANQDFFYREYGDPRRELEQAGAQVTVAAGRRAQCRPHGGSGQGPDGGNVQADIALADVRADEFDAILFSGGWGASAYQYAFEGRYTNPGYNGDRSTKTEVNRVIGEFIAQDKYVAALCNGVSVLAWARVDGESPLSGKRVCAPVREAPPGTYNGRQAQPSCRWHPEQNGAILLPPGSVGDTGTNADDISVDGRIITGEDDISAQEMGRVLVRVLSE
jgi:putative intracellular protease/amidase